MAKIIISLDEQVLQEVQLNKERMTIGRNPHNDIVIDDRTVSGEHAAVTTILNDAFLEDLGSTNGTFVNGHRISKHVLAGADRIMLARFHLKFIPTPRGQVPQTAPADAAPAPVAVPLPRIGHVQVINGSNAGKTLPLTKPLTTLGRPGVVVAVIARRPDGYFIAHIEGDTIPTVNGTPVGKDPRMLAHGDTVDLAGTQMSFRLP